MKKQLVCVVCILLLILPCLLLGCNENESIFGEASASENTSPTANYEGMIRELENQIVELQQNQYISDAERQQELLRLQELLAQLKQDSETTPPSSEKVPNDTQNTETPPANQGKFLYTTSGNSATITGYTGTDTHLVIPSVIDGYTVTAVADNAFSSHTTLQSVVISNGVEKLGWFAFQGCNKLTSLTVSASLQSIGYSAFSGVSDRFTLYCPDGSFAQQYAQSYGLRSAVI